MTPEQAKQLQEHGLDADWAAEHDCMIPADDFEPECIRLALWEYACKKWLDKYAPDGWTHHFSPKEWDETQTHEVLCYHWTDGGPNVPSVFRYANACAPTRLEAMIQAVLATEKEE